MRFPILFFNKWNLLLVFLLLQLLVSACPIIKDDNSIVEDSLYHTELFDKLQQIELPIIEIWTVNGELPTFDKISAPPNCWGEGITNATKVPGKLIIHKGGNIVYDSGNYNKGNSGITIKIRGNTSAYDDKKPYKIKLQKKADLLFRNNDEFYKDKNWLLLKDEELHKNIGFKVNELVGMPWTPQFEYVNVVLNGDYIGIYMLVEAVNRSKSRLDVDDSGYIFEYDAYWWNENVYVQSPTLSWPMHYTFKYPDEEDITEYELSIFQNIITIAEKSLNDGTYPIYLDVESFANWILAHDILGNRDSGGSNIFMIKKNINHSSKIQMANLWDLEDIFFMYGQWAPIHDRFYYNLLFNSSNDIFRQTYKKRWKELEDTLFTDIMSYLNELSISKEAISIDQSMELNNLRWNTNFGKVCDNLEEARSWFEQRKTWLSLAIAELITVNMKSMVHQASPPNVHNLQGIKISTPRNGIYVVNNKVIFVK